MSRQLALALLVSITPVVCAEDQPAVKQPAGPIELRTAPAPLLGGAPGAPPASPATDPALADAALALKRGDVATARKALETFLDANPADVGARLDLALLSWRQGDVDPALRAAREALARATTATDTNNAKWVLSSFLHELDKDGEAEPLIDAVVAARPQALDAQLLQGLVKFSRARYDEATTIFDSVLARDPSSPQARLVRSLLWWLEGDVAQAQQTLEQLAQEHPEFVLAHYRLAEVRLEQGDTAGAVEALHNLIEASSNRVPGVMQAAATLIRYGALDEAVQEIKQLIEEQPKTAVLLRPLLADAYLRQGRVDAAEVELQTIIAANPTAADGNLRLGQLYLSQRRPQEAMEKFRAAEKLAPKAVEPKVGQLDVAILQGDAKAALAAAKAIQKRRGDSPETEAFLGAVYERLKQPNEAEKIYRSVLKQHPGNLAAMRQLALVCMNTGRMAEARTLMDEALAVHPETILLQLDRAMLDERAGKTQEAAARYRAMLARHRYDPVALNNLAFLLAAEAGGLDEADTLARRALRLAPDEPHVIDTLGWIAYHRGRYDEAAGRFLRAIDLDPDAASFHYHLGLAYLKQGKNPQARLEFNATLKDPDFRDASAARAALKSLQ